MLNCYFEWIVFDHSLSPSYFLFFSSKLFFFVRFIISVIVGVCKDVCCCLLSILFWLQCIDDEWQQNTRKQKRKIYKNGGAARGTCWMHWRWWQSLHQMQLIHFNFIVEPNLNGRADNKIAIEIELLLCCLYVAPAIKV